MVQLPHLRKQVGVSILIRASMLGQDNMTFLERLENMLPNIQLPKEILKTLIRPRLDLVHTVLEMRLLNKDLSLLI